MAEFNSEVVVKTLEQVVKILEINGIEYRFLGSVVAAAINGELHRDLGDLDMIIDVKGRGVIFNELKNIGYKPAAGGLFSFSRKFFSLDQISHLTLLDVGFFYGRWLADGSFVIGNNHVGLSIESYAIKPTKYSLNGIEFIGIPPQAAATGINASKTNPKRKREIIMLRAKGIEAFPNNYIHIHFFGLRLDWVYHVCMKILNVIGAIRVKMGLAFDPWR